MTEQQFTSELDTIQKPAIAKIPFIWSILKGWICKNAEAILILLLQLIATTSKNPNIRTLAKKLIEQLLVPNKLMVDDGDGPILHPPKPPTPE